MSDSDYDQLEFRHLKYIKAIAETGGFTAASDRVHSHAIHDQRPISSAASIELLQRVEFSQTRESVESNALRRPSLYPAGEDLLALREEIRRHVVGSESTPARLPL